MFHFSQQHIDAFLQDLASSAPAPGGGAVSALQVAMGAGLVMMVCNLTKEDPEGRVAATLQQAEDLKTRAVALADEDAAAFQKVIDAYALPRATAEQKQARSNNVQDALRGAGSAALRIVQASLEVVCLASELAPHANPHVITDVGCAACCAQAAAAGAGLNVRVNVSLLRDAAGTEEMLAALRENLSAIEKAVTATLVFVEKDLPS